MNKLRKNGYVAYLSPPLPHLIARSYDKMYQVNEMSRAAREGEPTPQIEYDVSELRRRLRQVNEAIDRDFPDISRNFGPPVSEVG